MALVVLMALFVRVQTLSLQMIAVHVRTAAEVSPHCGMGIR
jgi:hypothetical protein